LGQVHFDIRRILLRFESDQPPVRGFELQCDEPGRSVLCNLDAVTERPELRQFARNPLEEVRGNRGAYIVAALSVIKAYLDAGAPDVCDQLGSCGDWSRMVRSPLVWLGLPDPIASMDVIRTADPVLTSIRQFLCSGWFTLGREYRMRDIIDESTRNPDLEELPSHGVSLRDVSLIGNMSDPGAAGCRSCG
jgi:hypothetical protein